MSPLSVPNFSPIRDAFVFYGGFCEVCEMKMNKKKSDEIKTKLAYLGNGRSDFLQI